MTSGCRRGTPYSNSYERELVSKPAISLKKCWGGGAAVERLLNAERVGIGCPVDPDPDAVVTTSTMMRSRRPVYSMGTFALHHTRDRSFTHRLHKGEFRRNPLSHRCSVFLIFHKISVCSSRQDRVGKSSQGCGVCFFSVLHGTPTHKASHGCGAIVIPPATFYCDKRSRKMSFL